MVGIFLADDFDQPGPDRHTRLTHPLVFVVSATVRGGKEKKEKKKRVLPVWQSIGRHELMPAAHAYGVHQLLVTVYGISWRVIRSR